MTEYDENGVITTPGPFQGSHTRPGSVTGHEDEREIIWHRPVDSEVTERGDETHPAWGMVSVHRVSSTPGSVLFDSDVQHQHFVRVTLRRAIRQRSLNRDWLHPESKDLFEIDMSEAQWASFVSSFNTGGVPCTIRATENNRNVDGLHFEPRLKESMAEVKGAARKMVDRMKAAVEAYDALPPNAGVKARREAMDKIRLAVEHTEGNMEFAAKSLEEHTENVVQKARVDIEAMVYAQAERLGLDPRATLNSLALGEAIAADTKAIEGSVPPPPPEDLLDVEEA